MNKLLSLLIILGLVSSPAFANVGGVAKFDSALKVAKEQIKTSDTDDSEEDHSEEEASEDSQ